MPEDNKLHENHYVVTDSDAIHFMSPDVPPVLSTPSMIYWMELTSRDNASSLLRPGDDTVGVSVDIKHLAATPIGMRVRVVSKLIAVKGRFYSFEVIAFDQNEKIGEGIHQRASVTMAKFGPRMIAKQKQIHRTD